MLYFASQNLVYLANPKTGTTAIEKALARKASLVARSPSALRHMNVATYRRSLEPLLAAQAAQPPRLFIVVRDPIQRLLSWYRYRQREEIAGTPKSTAHLTPEAFLIETMKSTPAPYARIGSQARFVSAGSSASLPEYLFPYEHPGPLELFLKRHFGVEQLAPANVSPVAAQAIDPKIAARVRAHRAEDYALYDAVLSLHGISPSTF